jgi:Zn-finger in ubiquitin-hydrolases and other protein
MIPGQSMALGASAMSPNGSAPRCEHLDGLAPVTPQSDECRDCRSGPGRPVALLVCLSCGWVACSDDSPNRHARAHYEETDHPLARAAWSRGRTGDGAMSTGVWSESAAARPRARLSPTPITEGRHGPAAR